MVRKSGSFTKKMSSSILATLSGELQKIIGIDSSIDTKFGVRVSSEDSWVLVRESVTEPVVRITTASKQRSTAHQIMRETFMLLRRALKYKVKLKAVMFAAGRGAKLWSLT